MSQDRRSTDRRSYPSPTMWLGQVSFPLLVFSDPTWLLETFLGIRTSCHEHSDE
jgi:hypothetical protein